MVRFEALGQENVPLFNMLPAAQLHPLLEGALFLTPQGPRQRRCRPSPSSNDGIIILKRQGLGVYRGLALRVLTSPDLSLGCRCTQGLLCSSFSGLLCFAITDFDIFCPKQNIGGSE